MSQLDGVYPPGSSKSANECAIPVEPATRPVCNVKAVMTQPFQTPTKGPHSNCPSKSALASASGIHYRLCTETAVENQIIGTKKMKRLAQLITVSAAVILGAASAQAVDAKAIFTKECAKCHGADGKGNTKFGRKLGAKDYTDPKFQATLKDEEMAKAIRNGLDEDGKNKMKPNDKLTDEEIKALVEYMRAFAKK